MIYITKEFFTFFNGLQKNNTTEWFNDNRKAYEQHVKKPFSLLIDEMIRRNSKHEPDVKITASDAIMRINKDIRFSKDKTPYNTHVSANISKYGKKNKAYPGFYLQLGAKDLSIFGGAYMLEKEDLEKIRKGIKNNSKKIKAAITNPDFSKLFGELQGEIQLRLPTEYKDAAAKEPLITRKQFYYSASLPTHFMTSEKLCDNLMKYYLAARPVNKFLQECIND